MKKNKLSVITFIISLLPFITLLISLFTEEITGGLQTGLITSLDKGTQPFVVCDG